jgi:hypothetical protein
MLWTDSMGRLVVALGVVGAACMAIVLPGRALLLLLFPVTFFLFITNTTPASRYLNPVLPFLALFASWMVGYVVQTLRVPRNWIWAPIVAIAISPLIQSIRSNAFFRADDTRTLTQRFVESRIPDGATILVQPYSVSLVPSRAGLVEALEHNLGNVEAASTKFQLQLSLDPYPAPAYRLIWLGRGGLDAEKIYVDPKTLWGTDGLAELERLGVRYVILKRFNNLDPDLSSFVTVLSRRGRLLAAFSPYRADVSEPERRRIEPFLHNTDTRIHEALERPGPPMEIWQLNGPDS